MMLTNSTKNQLVIGSSYDDLQKKNLVLNIFLYLTQRQREQIEYFRAFLQKYKLELGFLTKEKRFGLVQYFQVNANFLAQSTQSISPNDFAAIISFLSAQSLIVYISYQNQIWTVSRFLKWHAMVVQTSPSPQNEPNMMKLHPHTYRLNLTRDRFLDLWGLFNSMSF